MNFENMLQIIFLQFGPWAGGSMDWENIGHCWSFSWANIKLWARLPSLCWHGSL